MSTAPKTVMPAADREAGIDVLQMVNGYRISQLISVSARLRLADHVAEGPRPVASLGEVTGVRGESLYRALRALASCGIFAEVEPRSFGPTPLSEPLRSGQPGVRAAAALIAEPWHWQTWENLDEAVRTGEPWFEVHTGVSFAHFCANHEDLAAGFEEAAADLDALTDPAVLSACGLHRFRRLVVFLPSGSSGNLVVHALKNHPQLRVIVCVDSRTVARVQRIINESDLASRCEIRPRDATADVASGGDAYLLRGVAHDFDDAALRSLLAKCAEAMMPGGRVFVAEMHLGGPNQPSLAKILDLDSLLFIRGARERSIDNYAKVLESVGLGSIFVHQSPGPVAVLEAAHNTQYRTQDSDANGATSLVPLSAACIQILRLAGAFRVARALGVVSEFAIADRLVAGPRACDELALESKTHSDSLYRLLRALSVMGIFQEQRGGVFALTSRGAILCADHPRSLRASALVFAEHWHWRMWGQLEQSLRRGEPAYEFMYGCTFLDDCKRNKELFRRVALSKACAYKPSDEAVAKAYDFGRFRRLLDLGAGEGALSALLLRMYPNLYVTLFDHDNASEACQRLLDAPGMRGRVAFVSGDYQHSVPTDADIYLLRGVLHNFDDDAALQVLINCRRAMPANALLLIIEMVLPPGSGTFAGKFIDVESMLLTRGREREEVELRALINSAGLRLSRIVATDAPVSLLECVQSAFSPTEEMELRKCG